jgi:hypothetical protein
MHVDGAYGYDLTLSNTDQYYNITIHRPTLAFLIAMGGAAKDLRLLPLLPLLFFNVLHRYAQILSIVHFLHLGLVYIALRTLVRRASRPLGIVCRAAYPVLVGAR